MTMKRSRNMRATRRSGGNPKIAEEIIFHNILLKLSAKSVLRFKSVRKSWYSAIQNPRFQLQYLLNSRSRVDGTAFLLYAFSPRLCQQLFFSASTVVGEEEDHGRGGDIAAAAADYSYIERCLVLDTGSELRVSQSVNGLFCIYPSGFSAVYAKIKTPVVSIFNPSTREVVSLPPLAQTPRLNTKRVCYHFGFDSVHEVYKVLCLFCSFSEFKFQEGARVECQIFTVGGSKWRKLNCVIPVSFEPDIPGVYASGSINWIIKNKRVLLAFDLGNEVFRVIQLHADIHIDVKNFEVEDFDDDNNDDEDDDEDWFEGGIEYYDGDKGKSVWPCLIQVGGFLAVVEYNDRSDKNILRMWVLKDFQNEQWEMESMSYPDHWNLYHAMPFGSTHYGEVFLSLKHGLEPGCPIIVCCNLSEEIIRDIELPEADKMLERDDSRFLSVDLISCYPENIMPLRR